MLVDFERGFIAATEYVPAQPSPAHVVICSSIMADFLHNLRREVVLARWLCTRGCHVVRFHYLGTGNSDGGDEAATLDQMTQDALDVAERFIDDSDGGATTWVGTRLGAFPAARAAANRGDQRLALIDPVVLGKTYVKEGFRARIATNAKEGSASLSTAALKQELETTREVDILGHTLTHQMYEQLLDADLSGVIGSPSAVLLAQLGGEQMKKGLAGLNAQLTEQGADTTTLVIDDNLGWWFAESEALPDDDIIARLGTWLLPITPDPFGADA